MKRLAALVVMVSITATPVAAAQSGLDAARARVGELEQRIERGQATVTSLQSQMRTLAAQVGREQHGLATTREDLARTNGRIKETRVHLGEIREALGARTRQLYIRGGPLDIIGLLVGARSFGDFIGRANYGARVAANDKRLMLDARAQEAKLRAMQERQQRIEREQAGRLSALRSRRDQLTDAFARQQAVLADLARARAEALRLIADLESRLGSGLGNLRRVAGQGMTISYGQWASSFLTSLGAPASRNNMIAVVAWEAAEGTQATWNPLATTKHMPGATIYNSHGVRNYVSKGQGIEASILTLKLPNRGYEPVIARLRASAKPMSTAEAIRDSLWCSGCAGGTYVVGFIEAVTRYYDRYAN